MYSTCIVWMAFIPIFFGTNHDYTVQSIHNGSFDKLFTKLWREVTLIQSLVNSVLLQGSPGIYPETLNFPPSGPDIQPGDVRHGVRHGGPGPPLRSQDVPGAAPPGEMCQELPRQQETKQ